ncbi:MAG: ATP-binding protein [Longimonas sp.]|uniref:GAF domain-containing sensor histidine kinase n=1 Tax=Longimonas sp. TaxID=2039626 RepID=UPI00336402BC
MNNESTDISRAPQEDTTGRPDAPERLNALQRYHILDTPPEEAFDHITDLAAHVLDMPMAVVNFIDAERQWFKSCVGIEDIRETPLDQAFCNITIRTPGLLVVGDTLKDERFTGNPFVAGPPHLRFYMGMPLTSPDGYRVGTLCVMDTEPRTVSKQDRATMRKLAGVVMDELEMRATESQRAYRELQNREKRLRDLANSVPGVVFRVRAIPAGGAPRTKMEIRGEFISGYAEQLLGYPVEEHDPADAFRWFIERVPAAHRRDFRDSIAEAVEAGAQWEHEMPFVRPDGTRIWIRAASTPDPNATRSDELVYNGVLLDNTIQKRAEAQLRRSKEEAEEMSRLKSSFLTNMGHEVRTPLSSIIGFAEVLNDMELEGPARRFSRLMHRSSKRLLDTLDAVLYLSQLEAGSVSMQPAPLSASATLYDVASSFQAKAKAKNLSFEVDLPDSTAESVFDRDAFERVLSCVIDNAVKFTSEAGRVSVRMQAEPETIVVTVADTGVGIDVAFFPHLFTAFKQSSTGNRRAYEGSGLGLTIVQQLLKLMQGSMVVRTTPGEGTTFTVRVPRYVEKAGSARQDPFLS